MRIAEFCPDEELRIADLHSYQILDTPHEQAFDQLVELAQTLSGCPIVFIGFIDEDRQWFKAERGVDRDSVDRSLTICQHTIATRRSMVVEDLKADERFCFHPFVDGGLCLRFYAGSSILSPAGRAVGTICVADLVPRSFTPQQLRSLEILSQQAGALLEARLKNLRLQSRAGQLIQLEQKTVQRNLEQQERERQEIGYELHEHFAQTLAACNNFLGVAEHDEGLRLRMIRQTRVELQRLTRDMRSFSRKLTPTTLERFDVADMLKALVREEGQKAFFSIRFETAGSTTRLPREVGLALYRNVQEFLQLLSASDEVTNVLIRLKAGTKLSLLLMDNRRPQSAVSLEQDTLIRTIHNRTLHFGGTVQYKPFSSKGNALLMTLTAEG